MTTPMGVGTTSAETEITGSTFWRHRWERSTKGISRLPAFEDVAIGSLGAQARLTLVLGQVREGLSVLRCAPELEAWLLGPEAQLAKSEPWLAVQALARASLARCAPAIGKISALVAGQVEVRDVIALPLSSCWSSIYVLIHVGEPSNSYGVIEHMYRSTREGFATLAPARDTVGQVVDLKIVSANPGLSRLVGIGEDRLIGRRVSELGSTAEGEPLLDLLMRCFADEAPTTFELEVATDEGGARHLSCSATVQDGLIFVTLADVTEIRSRERSFRLLFESNPVPMWLVDVDTMRFIDVNAAALAHYGFDRATFLALDQFALLHPEEHAALRDLAADGSHSYDGERHWRHLRADGSEILVLPYARSLSLAGRRAALAGFIDVTAMNASEQDLRRTRMFLDTIIDNIPSALVVRDAADRSLLLVNKAGEQLFGIDRTAALGRPLEDGHALHAPGGLLDHGPDRNPGGAFAGPARGEIAYASPVGPKRTLDIKRLTIPDADGRPRYLLGLAEDVTERREIEGRIAYLAHHDALTGLPNRAFLGQILTETLARSRRGDFAPAVHVIDLDAFKLVNDTLGHSAGDELLVQVARRLQDCLGADDVCARFGGDEFVILQAGPVGPAVCAKLAERVVSVIARPYVIHGQEVRVGTSLGIAIAPADGNDAETLLRNADLALYRAKAEGKSRFRFFEAEMNERLQERRALEIDLRTAVERGEFELFYQPLIDMNDDRVCCCEALLRWRHPERGFVSPADFIPLAEETGLIAPIGEWVMRAACAEARGWPAHIRVAVNVSPIQFHNPRLVEAVISALAASGLAPQRLEIEITESVLLANSDANLLTLRRLRDLGIRIALDDFGTGYSSLGYLQTFPFDKIKIDRSFIQDLGSSARSDAIVGAIAGLGRHLGITTVAEGVETAEQLVRLRSERYSQVQGFFFSRPLPAERLRERLAGHEAPRGTSPVGAAA